jgi:hypothetical protein
VDACQTLCNCPSRHLWTDAAVHDETCRGVHCISCNIFWAINVLFQL